jgi:ribosomal protein S18 acetylase RimI-like enzyme
MQISPMTLEQAPGAIALWQAAGLTRPSNDPHADFARAVQGPSSVVLAGRREGDLVATAMVGHDGHRGWVYYLAVDARARGQGLGRAMMAACERWLRERDIPKIDLMVRCDNGAVQGFYSALGYTQDDVIVLSRRLDQGLTGNDS